MSRVLVDLFGLTDAGSRCDRNFDAVVCEPIWDDMHFLLAVVGTSIDAVEGDVASRIARDVIVRHVTDAAADKRSRQADLVRQVLIEANNAIVEQKKAFPSMADAACAATVVVFSLADGKLHMAHCGDSRLYAYFDGRLMQLSVDRQAMIRREGGDRIFGQCLGAEVMSNDDHQRVDVGTYSMPESESQYLLCTDGLSKMLTTEEIQSVLASESTPEQEVLNLIRRANDAGGKDNMALAVIRFSPVGGAAESSADDTPALSSRRRKVRLSPRFRSLLPWLLLAITLLALLVLGIRYYADRTAPDPIFSTPDGSVTVIIEVDNEMESLPVDTMSRVVMQARDSLRVDIPRGANKK